ncbi:MAG: hypothetical protein EVG15_09245 [Candidatus Acididesulfobacter diazotrophicus]|jgi:hypothetical protein|uniref:Uncharacterized protein n=1 Tax=Candidatus Acididesulfobacter diazotrophicus TaxID=2597226 RepID=A0A519BKM5_9DELT|nr:MAG: hypothetical protein EVG15_09245 [Candidatus Acididesulfobacter diazotrophicus]
MNYVFTIFAVILTAVLTTFFEYYFNIKRDRQNKKNRLLILLASIKTELFIIKKREQEIIGNAIDEIDKSNNNKEDIAPIIRLLKNNQDYFIIYNNSSHELIGLIGQKNEELQKNIVESYTLAKTYFVELIYYGELYVDYIKNGYIAPKLLENGQKLEIVDFSNKTHIKNKTIFNYYNYIKEERKKLFRLVDRVISDIDKLLESAAKR